MSAHGLGTNGVVGQVTLPTVADGRNSRPFTIASGAKVLTIFAPALVGAGTTLALQVLTPGNDGDTEVWTNVSYTALVTTAPVTFIPLNIFPEDTVSTVPVSAIGGGIFRFVASADQTGAADVLTIKLFFGMDG